MTAAQSFANGLQVWSNRSVSSTNDLQAVAFADGKFVAVGAHGIIFVSSDGTQWRLSDSPTESTLRGIEYGANKFVAVGDGGAIVTSENATNWVLRNSGSTAELFGVAYGGGQFVAVGRLDVGGYQGIILTSPDGVEWTSQDSGVQDPLYAVTYGAGNYIVVGHLSAVASADGSTWRRIALPNYGPVFGITYGNNRFVTVESDLYTPTYPFSESENGANWSNTSAATDGPGYGIAFASGLFAAIGALTPVLGNPTNQLAASTDGEHWTLHDIGLIPELRGIAYGVKSFVVVGLSGTIMQSGQVTQPRLAAQRKDEKTIQITLSGDLGAVYRLQISTNFASGIWSDFMTLTNSEGTVTVSDSFAPQDTQRVYRAVDQ